jgi:hypothetical protein
MAILCGRHIGSHDTYTLELAALLPEPEGERHAYRLSFLKNEEILYQRQHTVRGWATHLGVSHIHVYSISRVFQKANGIMDARSRILIYAHCQEWSVSVGAEFVEFVLWGLTHPRFGRLFHVQAYLLEEKADPLSRYLFAHFTCLPEDAAKFGEELEAECDAAEKRRQELGDSV